MVGVKGKEDWTIKVVEVNMNPEIRGVANHHNEVEGSGD